MKKLIYTVICFKCILQITEGGPYHKYIKLFSQLLLLCMCCGMLLSFAGEAKKIYGNLDMQWRKITSVTSDAEEDIRSGSEYYEEKLMEALEYETETDVGETAAVD